VPVIVITVDDGKPNVGRARRGGRRSRCAAAGSACPARVVAGGRGDLVDLRQPRVRQRPAGGRQAARLGHLPRRIIRLGDQPVVYRSLVQAAQRGDQVLLGVASAAGVAAGTTWVLT